MKRTDTVFTCINALVVMIMLFNFVYFFSALADYGGQILAFYLPVLYIPVFVIINVIWMIIRKKLVDKQPFVDLHARNERKRIYIKRLNTVGTVLNILLLDVLTIHIIVVFVPQGNSGSIDVFMYSLPFVLINDAWVVVFVNIDDRLEERYLK